MQKKCQKKNDNFWHFAKHRFIKNPVLLQPPFFWKNVFFNLFFLKPKTMMLNKKHNSKTGKKQRQGKEIWKRKQDRKPKKENILMKKRNSNLIFSCSFQETKAQKIEQKKRQKQERKRKPKKKDKKEERKTRAKQRDRERESEKGGGQKRLREKERETLKINQKMPFLGGKTVFSIKNKERKGSKKKENKKNKTNKKNK